MIHSYNFFSIFNIKKIMCKIVLIIPFVLASICSYAQIYTGGTIGANMANNILLVEIAPEIGYKFENNITVGTSPFFNYLSQNSSSYKEMSAGLRLFSEYTIINGLFLRAELEGRKLWNNEGYKTFILGMPVGGGYEREIAPRTHAHVIIMYDVLHKQQNSYKQNPEFRAGIRYDI